MWDAVSRRQVVSVVAIGAFAGCVGSLPGTGSHDEGEVFATGEIDILIDDEPLDLTADRFQAEHADDYAIEFHLHDFDEYWYMEGDRYVTLAEGLDKLPEFSFETTDDDHVLTIDDETYDTSAGAEISFLVNEESVTPADYTLADGDEILVEITTEQD